MRMTWRFDRRRRRFLHKAGAAAAVAALGPLNITERTIAQTRTLYVNSWGGSFTAAQDAAYFKPFTALTSIQIRTVTPVSYAKIKAQVQAGRFEFDMTSINSMLWLRASREGLAEPIDWSIFKKGTLPAHYWPTACRWTSSIRSTSTARSRSSTRSNRTSRSGGGRAINRNSSSAMARSI